MEDVANIIIIIIIIIGKFYSPDSHIKKLICALQDQSTIISW